MKQELNSGSTLDLIAYRLQRAKETLVEADYNAKGEYYNAAVNRLYYACYYAVSALMLTNNLDSSSHKGIKTMLGLHFIKSGIIDVKYGRIYQQLFENRQSSDYEDFVYCDAELFNTLRPEADEFVEKMIQLCKNSVSPTSGRPLR